MGDYSLIFLGAILVNNLVLDQMLGVCPTVALSRSLETAREMTSVTLVVLVFTALLGYFTMQTLLLPLGLEYLYLIVVLLLLTVSLTVVHGIIKRTQPALYESHGIFLPVNTANCAVLGVALIVVQESWGLFASLVFGVGSALGMGLVLVLLAGLRERLATADVPEPFRGTSITLITLGILSMAFMGFIGLIRV